MLRAREVLISRRIWFSVWLSEILRGGMVSGWRSPAKNLACLKPAENRSVEGVISGENGIVAVIVHPVLHWVSYDSNTVVIIACVLLRRFGAQSLTPSAG